MTAETTTNTDVPNLSGIPSPPASKQRMIGFATGALLAGIAVVVGLSQLGSEHHAGYLDAATEAITAGRQARIVKILVKPGDAVKPGTPLVLLKDASLEATRANQVNAIAALEAELRQAQAKASVEIADRKAKLESEIFEAQLKLAGFEEKRFDHRLSLFAADNRVLMAEAEAGTFDTEIAFAGKDSDLPIQPLTISKPPLPKGYKRDHLKELQDRESTRNKLEASEAQAGLCEERLKLLKKQLEGVPVQINEAFGVNVIQTRITTAQTSLAQLDAETPTLTIVAKKHGTVGVFAKANGEMIEPTDEIVELFDADQPYVMLEVSTILLAKFPVKAGVELVFPDGTIRKGEISPLPPQASSLPGPKAPLTSSSGQIRLKIRPTGHLWPSVPFGTRIEVRRPVAAKTVVAAVRHESDSK